jgi:hypothetical protein
MARLSFGQQPAIPDDRELIGRWAATTPHQAWTRLDINAQERIRIVAGQNQMGGTINAMSNGGLQLSLFAGAGENTASLDGQWQLEGEQLLLEFRAMNMRFKRIYSKFRNY